MPAAVLSKAVRLVCYDALLGQARESARKIDVLRGIANSGYVGALPAVRPYLTSEDALLRSAAVEALRLEPDRTIEF